MNFLNQLALGSALALAGPAQAAILLDGFGDLPPTLSIVNPPGPLTVSYGPTVEPWYGLGPNETRNVTYSITALGPTVDAVKNGVGGSGLIETADNNGVPSLVLDYTGFAVDLFGFNTLGLYELRTDANLQVQAMFFDGAAGVSSSGWVTVPGNYFDFITTLRVAGTANLADIEHINLQFQGDPGADFSLMGIALAPEPSTYGALTALGLLGMVIWRRGRA